MTKIENLCDRCGQQITYAGWTGIVKKKPERLFLRKLFNGNPDGYSYSDLNVELCKECCKSFDNWFEEVKND